MTLKKENILEASYPSISIIIPTLNSSNVLEECLISIKKQNYPQTKIEILIIDGGSRDSTLQIAKKYNCLIINNSLKTAEAAKAIGVKIAKGEYIALIDSDNILPSKKWLKRMIQPLIKHPELIGSEPWSYTYRKNGGFIERYSSLTGVNDPYTLIAGNYDRKSYLHNNWTNLNLNIKNYEKFN